MEGQCLEEGGGRELKGSALKGGGGGGGQRGRRKGLEEGGRGKEGRGWKDSASRKGEEGN